jgi:hypothetical protein
MIMELRKLSVRYTADVISPDGSDTDVYGEPTSPGDGYVLSSGWFAPDWSLYTVSDDPAYGQVDRWSTEEGDPVTWLRARLTEHLVTVDHAEVGTFYSAATHSNMAGETTTVAAHAEGFTSEELAAAIPCGHYYVSLDAPCPICGEELG